MNDSTITQDMARNIRNYMDSVVAANEYRRNLARSLIIECGGRMYEAERLLHEALTWYEHTPKEGE